VGDTPSPLARSPFKNIFLKNTKKKEEEKMPSF